MLFQMILSPIDAIIKLFMNGISRYFEWQADQFACDMDEKAGSHAPEGLMSDRLGRALISLHVENLSTVWVDWM